MEAQTLSFDIGAENKSRQGSGGEDAGSGQVWMKPVVLFHAAIYACCTAGSVFSSAQSMQLSQIMVITGEELESTCFLMWLGI